MTEPTAADGPRGEAALRWIFRGPMVVPTGNPFAAAAAAADTERQLRGGRRPDEDENAESAHQAVGHQVVGHEQHGCTWLGPGLQLLADHILTVDNTGFIRHLEPAASFLSARNLTSAHDYCNRTATAERSIEESAAAEAVAVVVVQLQSHEFLCPGLIDLHIHAPQFAYAGTATNRPLMGPDGWLETYTFPAERRLGAGAGGDSGGDSSSGLALAREVYRSVVSTTLRHGTTTAVYFATLHVEPCRVLVDCAWALGQRALIGKVCMDRHAPRDYCQSLAQNVRETEQLLTYIYDKAGRRRSRTDPAVLPLILPLVTPRFIPTCTPELLSALGEIARRHDCHVTSHISESVDEVAFSRHLDDSGDGGAGGGRTDAEIFDAHQLLTDQCVMAHGVHLSDADGRLLHRRGAAVAHCPLSNFFFAGGVLPCRRLMQRGYRVGLGTDVAGGYNPSLWHSSRLAVVASHALQQQQQQQQQGATTTATAKSCTESDESAVLDYRHAFYLATLGGAEALGLQHRIGTLAVGLEFDALVLSPAPQSPVPHVWDSDAVADVFQKLCVLGDDRNVTRVFVQGREVTVRD